MMAIYLGEMTPREIVERSMKIAAEICIYSNLNVTVEELRGEELGGAGLKVGA